MTYRTIRELLRRVNFVRLPQLLSQCALIRRWRRMHRKNLIARSKVGSRIPVALEARVHRPCTGRDHYGQLIHLAMTGDATDALMDMDAVIEINVVRQIMDADPLDGFVFAET